LFGRERARAEHSESETERSRLAREMTRLVVAVSGLVALFCVLGHCQAQQQPNYRAALTNSLLYFEGQRSGRLPPDPNFLYFSPFLEKNSRLYLKKF
jgi:hypothetical protein